MTSLLSLPTKRPIHTSCIRELNHVRSPTLTFMTSKRQVHDLYPPVPEAKIEKHRNKHRMEAIFGKPHPDRVNQEFARKVLNDIGYYPLNPIYSYNPLEHLKYLELNGDLRWVKPLLGDDKLEDEAAKNHITSTGLQGLRSTFQKLNIESSVPEAFWKLDAEKKVHHVLPTSTDSWFTLGEVYTISPEILRELRPRRVSPADDENQSAKEEAFQADGNAIDNFDMIAEGNYVFTFYKDYRDEAVSGCASLFLDTNGGHCILESANSVNRNSPRWNAPTDRAHPKLSSVKKELGIQSVSQGQAEMLFLAATDLEEWLVNQVYTERANDDFCDLLEELEPGRAQVLYGDIKRFVRNVYPDKSQDRNAFKTKVRFSSSRAWWQHDNAWKGPGT